VARKRRRQVHTTATILKDLARRLDLTAAISEWRACRRWAEVVGEAAARRSIAVGLSHGTLKVIVESPTWSTELRMMSGEIIERLHQVAQVRIDRIRFHVGELPEQPPEPVLEVAGPLTDDQAEEVRQVLADVRDPELAAAIRRMLEARARRVPPEPA